MKKSLEYTLQRAALLISIGSMLKRVLQTYFSMELRKPKRKNTETIMKKNVSYVAMIFLFCLIMPNLLNAQTDWGENMDLVDIPIEYSFPSGVIVGDYSIGMDKLGIIIWSIEDPDNPEFLRRFPIRGDQSDWFIADDILYVHSEFEDRGYLDVIDIEDPINPRYVTEVQLPGVYQGKSTMIFPHGDYIYATTKRDEQMYRYSIENDPLNPELTGWRDTSIGNPFCYRDNLVVSSMEDDDRSSFLNISIMAENGRIGDSIIELENNRIYRISMRDDLVFAHAGESWFIIDISDPEDARIITELEGIFQSSSNTTLHVSERYRFHRDIGGNNIAVGDRGCLRIFNVDDPGQPELLAEFACPAYYYTMPSLVVDERMYAPVHENRPIDLLTDTLSLQIYDISDPDEPQEVSEIAIMSFYPSHLLLSIEDDLLGFKNCNSHYNIYEILEDESLELRSIIQSEEIGNNNRLNGVNGIIHNNVAFVAKGSEGVSAYSLDDPSDPELLENFNIQNAYVRGVFDSTLYLTTSDDHLNRFDVRNIDQLEELPEINVEEFRLGYLSTLDDYLISRETNRVCAYSFEENNTLQPRYSYLVNNGNSTHITVVDTLIITSEFRGDRLYEDWRLMVLRINEDLDTIAVLDQAEWIEGDPQYSIPLAPRDDGLLAVAGKTRIVIYDITNPRSVNIVGSCMTPNWSCRDVVWHGDYLYVSGMDDICRFRLLISDEGPVATPDTLDFGVQPQFSINWDSYILSSPEDEGLLSIIESGFEGDVEQFMGYEEFSGWVSADYEQEVRIRFRPLEVDEYTARIWYRTEDDTVSVFLKGITEGYDGISIEETNHPLEFAITDVCPNPFNSTTKITYSIPEQSRVTFQIYNTRGQLVDVLIDRVMSAGSHSVVWDGSNLSAGLYLARMEASGRCFAKKVILIR